jgi:fructosamine-3-kinase
MRRFYIAAFAVIVLVAGAWAAEYYRLNSGNQEFTGKVKLDSTVTLGSTDLSATAAQLNYLAGVTAGTVTASKAAVVGTTKNLNYLRVAQLDATALEINATSVTATAANRGGFQSRCSWHGPPD